MNYNKEAKSLTVRRGSEVSQEYRGLNNYETESVIALFGAYELSN